MATSPDNSPALQVRVFPDANALACTAAKEFLQRTTRAVRTTGRFTVALSGGSTPRLFFRALVGQSGPTFPWAAVHLFWGDERTVPPHHPESNYNTAREELLSKTAIPPANIHRMTGEEPSPTRAAAAYEEELRRFFALSTGEVPRFDLVFLGLGADGHTASLFPGTKALDETKRLAVANWVEKLGTTRLTLTLPVLNNAACVIFLVAGSGKAATLQEVLEGSPRPSSLPAQTVRPRCGELLWLVDAAAAAALKTAWRVEDPLADCAVGRGQTSDRGL
jgi:6-phosphogluconolactonase